MRTLLILSILLISLSSMAQKYESSQVIETAKSFLEDAVGPELIQHFDLDSNSYYEYTNFLGVTKWKAILPRKKTKGKFVHGHDMRFTLKHPDFLFAPQNYRTIYVELDSDLNLNKKINLQRLPRFLLTDSASSWLAPTVIDSIAHRELVKTPVEPMSKELTYDHFTGIYYWTIINVIYAHKCYSDCEFLHIDPITGEVTDRSEDRLHVMHCH